MLQVSSAQGIIGPNVIRYSQGVLLFAAEAPLTSYKLLLSLVLKFLFNTCLIKTFGFQSSCFFGTC